MSWQYQGSVFEEPEQWQGFVYLIHCHVNDKKYIGKKNFWTVKKLPPLKGKNRKRHIKTETDWRSYWGSSNALLSDLELFGKDVFSRQILYLCENKNQMSYLETKTQFEQRVLHSLDYYNEIIHCRITAKGL